MLLNILIDFKDGYTQYYAGERVKINDEDAKKFIGYGWASVNGSSNPVVTGQVQTLNIKDGHIGQHAEI